MCPHALKYDVIIGNFTLKEGNSEISRQIVWLNKMDNMNFKQHAVTAVSVGTLLFV